MTRRLVDVLVLGGHLGALTAGALLVRRGLKVLHVDHDGLVDGYVDGGRRLPLGPELAPGPRTSPIIDGVLEELALVTDAQRRLRPVESLQVLGPGLRLDLGPEGPRRRAELTRELGETRAGELEAALTALQEADEGLGAFLATAPPLPPSGLKEQWQARRSAATARLRPPPGPLTSDPVLGARLGLMASLHSHLAVDAPTPLHATRRLARALRPAWRGAEDTPPSQPLGRLLRERLTSRGGESLADGRAVAEELVLDGGRVAGVRVAGDRTEYGCRFVVSGLDGPALQRLLPMGGRKKKLDAALDSVRPHAFLFTTHLVLAAEGWPPGLGELAVWVGDAEAPLQEENALVLQRFPSWDETGRRRDDEVVLQVSCFVPAARREQGDAWLEGLEARVLDALRGDLLPFADRHLRAVSSPYLAPRGPARGSRLTPHLQLETDAAPAFGVGVLPVDTPYKNLFLASREVLPGLGTEGALWAGRRAADAVSALARKRDPLK